MVWFYWRSRARSGTLHLHQRHTGKSYIKWFFLTVCRRGIISTFNDCPKRSKVLSYCMSEYCIWQSSGHVRASTAGALSETNCHPWRYGRLMWCVSIRPDSSHVRMHNGQISQFPKIKRRLLEALPDPLFLLPQGQTDSEYAFALYLSHLKDPESLEVFSHQELKEAMLRTIQDINLWSREAGIKEVSKLHFNLLAKSLELLHHWWQECSVHTLCIE